MVQKLTQAATLIKHRQHVYIMCTRKRGKSIKTSFYCEECEVPLCRPNFKDRICWDEQIKHGVPESAATFRAKGLNSFN
jgi:hypothetical protein